MIRILYPDFHRGFDAELEEGVAGVDVALEIHRENAPEAAWATADGIVVYRTPIGPAELARAPKLRIVVRGGVGFDIVDLAACAARGIAVCNTPDYGTTEVADHAIAMMLTLTRGTAHFAEALRADPVAGWRFDAAPLVRRIRGGVFGVVGLGRIGTAAALRAKAFGMEIAFFDPYLPEGTDLALGFRRLRTLPALLAEADVVSIHTPLTPETRNMIDATALQAVKPGAILVNTARGPICDLGAIEAALRSGALGGAALDVLPEEPPSPDHPLIAAWRRGDKALAGRLLLSPHAAFYSAAGYADLRRKSLETAVLYLRDGVLRNCVNTAELAAVAR